jgi:hypothetical protein
VAVQYGSCEQKPQIWGEFWWVGEKHEWFFSTIGKRAKPTQSGSRTAPRAAGGLSASTSRR